MSFKVASKKQQHSLRRLTPKRLGDFQEDLTVEQQRENLVAKYQKLTDDNKLLDKSDPVKFENGIILKDLALQIRELNIICKRYRFKNKDIHEFMVDVLRKKMSKFEFELLVNEARKLYEKVNNMDDADIDKLIDEGKRAPEL